MLNRRSSHENPFLVHLIASLGGYKPLALSRSLHLPHQLEGEAKEPMILFEKKRGHRPLCHVVADLCPRWSEWAR